MNSQVIDTKKLPMVSIRLNLLHSFCFFSQKDVTVVGLVQFFLAILFGHHVLSGNVIVKLVLLAKHVNQVRYFFERKENIYDVSNKYLRDFQAVFG